ncbi:hypothetical protein ASG90_12310 [Nocardioides sp. Soil797]|nr:hypothetical protein ASG90_12310 [Nocardioides sp. Soil797]
MSSARRLFSGIVGAVVVSGVLLVPATSHAAVDDVTTYPNLELQARTNLLVNDDGFNLPPGSAFNSISPSINDDADVAFSVGLVYDKSSNSSRPGLWLGANGQGSIVHEGDEPDRFSSDVSLNDNGEVAFTIAEDGAIDSHLWVYDAESDTAEQRRSLPVTPSGHSTPSIDNQGTVVTRVSLGEDQGWLSTSAGNTGTLVASEYAVSGDPYYYLYSPTINDVGQVAGKIGTSPDGFDPVEIRRFDASGDSVRLLANHGTDADSPYASFSNSMALNDDGAVAVIAKRLDGTQVLLRADGTTTTEVVVAGAGRAIESFESFPPDINDADQIVFRATDAEGQAIYVAEPDGGLTRVVARGDQVQTDQGLGQVAQHNDDNVFGGAPEINAEGDVVFTAALTPADDDQVEWGTGVFVAYAETGPPPVTGSLHGSVTDANTGEPISDATVAVESHDGEATSTSTGNDGTYALDLAPGDYTVTTTAPGRQSSEQEVTITESGTVDLETTLTSALLEVAPGRLDLRPGLWSDDRSTITISNPGSADLAWHLTENAAWLRVAQEGGSLAPGGSVEVTVTADRSALPAGSYSAPISVTAKGLAAVTTDLTMKVGAADAPINVGGPAHKDRAKLRWLVDRKLGGGDYGRAGSSKLQRTKRAIKGTLDDALFRTRRVGNLKYTIGDLPAGRYRLSLGFVEHTLVKRGARLFDVYVDGTRVLRKYDVARHASRLKALTKTITVRHRRAGDMVIKLRGVRGKPILSTLRVLEKK